MVAARDRNRPAAEVVGCLSSGDVLRSMQLCGAWSSRWRRCEGSLACQGPSRTTSIRGGDSGSRPYPRAVGVVSLRGSRIARPDSRAARSSDAVGGLAAMGRNRGRVGRADSDAGPGLYAFSPDEMDHDLAEDRACGTGPVEFDHVLSGTSSRDCIGGRTEPAGSCRFLVVVLSRWCSTSRRSIDPWIHRPPGGIAFA